MTTPSPADLIVRAATIHTLAAPTPDPAAPRASVSSASVPAAPVTALAIRDGRIAATAGPGQEQDLLAAWRGPATLVIDDPGLTVLPAFTDTHNHLMLAARNILGVPVSQARDIAQIAALIRTRAAQTPPGEWIVTAADWHELQLAERRLPTAAELDQATADHPVLLPRGGHNAVLNSAALRAAGFGPGTPDMPGGFIARDAAGHPSGWVQDAALDHARRALPPLPEDALAAGLTQASAQYAAHGLGAVRDPAVSAREWPVYQRAALSVRSHAMIMTTPGAVAAAGSIDAYLDRLEDQGLRPGAGHGRLRLWGLKFVLDGGVEAAALTQPYTDRPGYSGELLWDPGELASAFATCARRGWPVGTHAMGDHAVAVLLDAIRAAGAEARPALVIEHGGLIADRVAEAVALGVHVTVQQALLDGLGPAFLAAWGPGRTAALFPWRELLDAGAWISAGTDHPIGPLDPLRAIHGMTTRLTPAGLLGPEHAITRAEAIRLYTVAGADFLRTPPASTPPASTPPVSTPGPAHGPSGLVPGAPADLVVYPADPFTCPDGQLLELRPAVTVLGGQLTYRADGS